MKIKVNLDCFIGGSFRSAGSTVDYDGPLSKWMEPVEGQSNAAAEPVRAYRKKSKE